MIRLVASDLDGTLLDSYRRITEENRQAIDQLQKNDIEFIINTGRDYQNVLDIAAEADLKCGMICSNGATGYNENGTLLFQHFIPAENVKKILKIFREMDFVPNLFSQHGRLSLLSEKELEEQILELSQGRGADRVFEVAGGKDTFQTAWKIARPNAVVTVVAMYEEDQILPLPSMYGKNLIFKTGGVDGCYCEQIMELIEEGRLDTSPLITHRTSLEHIMEAYEIFEKKQDGVIKYAIKV